MGAGIRPDLDGRSIWRVLDRILEQILKDLLDHDGIDLNQRQSRWQSGCDGVSRQTRLQSRQDTPDDLLDRTPLAIELYATGFQPRHVEEVVGQLGHAPRFLVDGLTQ